MANTPNWIALDRLDNPGLEDQEADVLIVEDDAAIADMYALELSMAGLRVRVASSGESAVAEAQRMVGYKVIVLDLDLPGMSGWTTLEELRHVAGTADVPVIVLSNTNVDGDDIASHGASEWHAKYWTTPSQLVDYVQRARVKAA
ncbi:MAG TPA: response regulator [Candidatus Dormibacteraeota bacterium]|nr:response regulator [Candidatus Dormibacteraeota bacterium]